MLGVWVSSPLREVAKGALDLRVVAAQAQANAINRRSDPFPWITARNSFPEFLNFKPLCVAGPFSTCKVQTVFGPVH